MKSFIPNSIRILILSILLWSCEDYSIDVPNYERKIVVEGFIEQNKFPVVYLTWSSGYFDLVDSLALRDLVITEARVAISDGEEEEVLTLFKNDDVFPPFFYGGTDLRGEVGKNYQLEITLQGETYLASTTIPEPVKLDSLWTQVVDQKDSLVLLNGTFTDDGDVVNYYRRFTKIKGLEKKYIPAYEASVPDEFFNGQTFSFSIIKGSESLSQLRDDVYFTLGDTIDVRICTMDKAHFEFWRMAERESYLAGNPFASVGNEIGTNVEGTKPALGIWGGYGATYYRIVAK